VTVAAIADVHGNLPALEAVLAEIEAIGVDAIVCCGDVASGPLPRETCEALMALEGARFVQGNADREAVDGTDEWTSAQLDARHRDFLAAFEDTVTLEIDGLGRVLFCHGTPRSDEEIVTAITPEARLAAVMTGGDVVVCGHVHVRFDRRAGATRVVNPGSVGLPYEGRAGAYWALLGPDVELRRTDYDLDAALARMRGHHPAWDDLFGDSLVEPVPPDEVTRHFEGMAPSS